MNQNAADFEALGLAYLGAGQVNIQTVYASKYVSDKAKGTVKWTPVKGVGNAQVGGHWKIVDNKTSTGITLAIQGEVEVPLPGLMKMVVAPVVESEFEKLVEDVQGHALTLQLLGTWLRELQDFVKATIAPYKYPRAIEFRDALPKTPIGKILRKDLKAEYKTRAGS